MLFTLAASIPGSEGLSPSPNKKLGRGYLFAAPRKNRQTTPKSIKMCRFACNISKQNSKNFRRTSAQGRAHHQQTLSPIGVPVLRASAHRSDPPSFTPHAKKIALSIYALTSTTPTIGNDICLHCIDILYSLWTFFDRTTIPFCHFMYNSARSCCVF